MNKTQKMRHKKVPKSEIKPDDMVPLIPIIIGLLLLGLVLAGVGITALNHVLPMYLGPV